jgi:hypothetical protein
MLSPTRTAILGVGRLNAFRLNAIPDRHLRITRASKVTVTVGGNAVRWRIGSLTVHDPIDDAPSTATITLETQPTVGTRLRVVVGMDPRPAVVFAGPIQRAALSFNGRPSKNLLAWACDAIDDTWRADDARPFLTWAGGSATALVQTLVATYAAKYGFAALVEANLPPVRVTFDGTSTLNDALRQVAKLVGGYFYWQDLICYFFVTPLPDVSPDPVNGSQWGLLTSPRVDLTTDDAQIRTRVYGKGHEEATIAAVDAGESKLPIADAVMFTVTGGRAISDWQRLQYTGVDLGGTGSLVGPGITPTSAPVAAIGTSTGVTPGGHTYAFTWKTAAGETLPSPVASVTVVGGSVPRPPAPWGSNSYYTGVTNSPPGCPAGWQLRFRVSICDDATNMRTALSDPSPVYVSNGYPASIGVSVTADMRGRTIYIERSDNNGPWTQVSSYLDSGYGLMGSGQPIDANAPIGSTVSWVELNQHAGNGNQSASSGALQYPSSVALSGIAVGPSATTARNVYRSAAGTTTPLRLLATIADNATTTYSDTTADAALGATAPATDNSGLPIPAGQIPAGATALPVTSTVWARSDGGWAIVGNGDVVVRYTGISGNNLIGIPASGNGAILAPINYNSTITGAAMLTGVTGLQAALNVGAPVAIWVQVDNADAQTALKNRIGGDGVVEFVIVDQRRGEPSLTALCLADLQRYAYPQLTAAYTTFDAKSRSGRPVHVTLWGLDLSLVITEVTIDHVGTGGPPQFHVTAGTNTLSLQDILRRLSADLSEGF